MKHVRALTAYTVAICLISPFTALAQDQDELPAAIRAALESREEIAPILDPTRNTQAQLDRTTEYIRRADEKRRALKAQAQADGKCYRHNSSEEEYDAYYHDLCFGGGLGYSLNAVEIPRHAAPFQVQLVFSDLITSTHGFIQQKPHLDLWEKRHICGGSLIAKDWVLTAAHCFQTTNPKHYGLRLDVGNIASDNAPVIPIKQMILHEDYDRSTHVNDVALIQLDRTGVDLDLSVPFGSRTAFGWPDTLNLPLKDASIHDSSTLRLLRADGSLEFIDIATGKRSLVATDSGIKKSLSTWSGPGWLILPKAESVTLIQRANAPDTKVSHSGPVIAADFDAETGALVVADKNGKIAVHRINRNRPPVQFDVGFQPETLEIVDRKNIRIIGVNGQEALWDLRRGTRISSLGPSQQASLTRPFLMAGSNRQIVTRNNVETLRINTVYRSPGTALIHASGRLSIQQLGDTEPRDAGTTDLDVPKLAVDKKGRRMIALGADGRGEIRDIRRQRVTNSFSADAGFYDSDIALLDEDRAFLIWNSDGMSEIRDSKTGQLIHQLNHSLPITKVQEASPGRLVVGTDFGTAEVWDSKTGKPLARVYHGETVNGTDLRGDRLLTWSGDGRIRLWSVPDGKAIYHHLLGPDGDASSARNPDALALSRIGIINLSDRKPTEPEFPTRVAAFGWGKIQSRTDAPTSARLRTLSLSPISWEDCIAQSQQLQPGAIDPKAFCVEAPERKTCRGDSGGPVIDQYELVGIVSRGSGLCKADGEPSTFVAVAHYRAWIEKQVCPNGARFIGTPPASGNIPRLCFSNEF